MPRQLANADQYVRAIPGIIAEVLVIANSFVAKLAHVGLLPDLNARNTAVVQDKSGGYFAIDPSLVDHGVPPLVMPLETWLGPWPPDIRASDARAEARR